MTTWTLVTGGARGLGAEICRTLATQGHNILVHYRSSSEAAQEVVQSCRKAGVSAEQIKGDFASLVLVQEFLRSNESFLGNVKALVNNVGTFSLGTVSNTPMDQWLELFQLNLHAPVALIQGLLPALRQHKGTIVNLGIAGIDRGYADTYCSAYSSAKVALWLSTRSLARELAPACVTVNMVSPGYMENSVVKHSRQPLPMGREGTLYEVAATVAFLLSESAAYITGQNIEVAGAVRL